MMNAQFEIQIIIKIDMLVDKPVAEMNAKAKDDISLLYI